MADKKRKPASDTQMLSRDDIEGILELYSGDRWPAPEVAHTLVDESSETESTLNDGVSEAESALHDGVGDTSPAIHGLGGLAESGLALPMDDDLPTMLDETEDLPTIPIEQNINLTAPMVPFPPQVNPTMQMGSRYSSVLVFFFDSKYDRDAYHDALHQTLHDVTSPDVFRHANWPLEKHAFVARLQVCINVEEKSLYETIYMGDSDAFDTRTLLWDAGAVMLLERCRRAGKVEVKIDPLTHLVAFVARNFSMQDEMEEFAEIDETFPIEALPIDYLRFDGVLQLGVGHRMTSLAEEALRIKVLSVRDGTGLGGFRLPPRFRLDGLILQGSPGRQVYLSQLFANQRDLASDDKVGRQIDHIHLGRDVDLGEGHFPLPPMSIHVLSVQYPHDLDKLSELLESWGGSIDKLVLWGYKDGANSWRLHEEYPLFMAMTTNNALPVKRISWIESRVGAQTFEWIRFSEIDCQIFGQNFQHLSVDTVSPGQLLMVLRGFAQSLSPQQIEDYLRRFHSELQDVPIMVKRLFFGTQNFSLEELETEVARIQAEQQALWSRLHQSRPAARQLSQQTSAQTGPPSQQTDEHQAWQHHWKSDTDQEP